MGEYTKGISKGRDYFVALDRRIKREKADPKLIAQDFVFGPIREMLKMVKAPTRATLCHDFVVKKQDAKWATVGKSLSDLAKLVKK